MAEPNRLGCALRERPGQSPDGSRKCVKSAAKVGTGATPLLRWRAIRATLGSPTGPIKIQL
jgi:hypothetical protein